MARIFRILLMVLLLSGAGESFAAKSEQFVDPMRPVRYQAPVVNTTPIKKNDQEQVNTKTWRLTAVLISAERSVAVINGKSLQEGEILNGFRLVEIMPDKVLLKNKQRKLVLRRSGTGLKKISVNKDVGKGSNP